jgi:protein ImuA
MPAASVIANLREKIGTLEDVRHRFSRTVPVCGLVDRSLPYRGLPLGCIHEVKGTTLANAVAFASLLSSRIEQKGAVLYIAPDRSLYPLGLLPYNVNLRQWIHVHARRSRDLAWTVLEALRCPQVSAVLAVIKAEDLTFCRRLQLAAENSGATGFLLGNANSGLNASAITRWRVSSTPGTAWELELLYCRGGRPGKWQVAWRNGGLEPLGSPLKMPVQRVTLASESALAG